MEYRAFLSQVQKRTALDSHDDAESALHATTAALGAAMAEGDRKILGAPLPAQLQTALSSKAAGQALDEQGFYDEVLGTPSLPEAMDVERVQIICQELLQWFDESHRKFIQKRAPEGIAGLFAEERLPRKATPPPHTASPHIAPGSGHTLADGKPGSQHPISEARPDNAHSQSVARSDNPHADTKLSSSQGLNEGSDLASGKPGSTRPISDYQADKDREID